LRPAQKVAAVAVPWAFLVVFAALYLLLIMPRMREGAIAALCFGGFLALVFACFFAAAVTFSRDVLTGRWRSERP
jgi:hypothetical protein